MACRTNIGDWVLSPYTGLKLGKLLTDDPSEVIDFLMGDPAKYAEDVFTYDNNCMVQSTNLSIPNVVIAKEFSICLTDGDDTGIEFCDEGAIQYPLILKFESGVFNNGTQTIYKEFNSDDEIIAHLNKFNVSATKVEDECCFVSFDVDEDIDINIASKIASSELSITDLGSVNAGTLSNPIMQPYNVANDGYVTINIINTVGGLNGIADALIPSGECARIEVTITNPITSVTSVYETISGKTGAAASTWASTLPSGESVLDQTDPTSIISGSVAAPTNWKFDKKQWAIDNEFTGVELGVEIQLESFVGGTDCVGGVILTESVNTDNKATVYKTPFLEGYGLEHSDQPFEISYTSRGCTVDPNTLQIATFNIHSAITRFDLLVNGTPRDGMLAGNSPTNGYALPAGCVGTSSGQYVVHIDDLTTTPYTSPYDPSEVKEIECEWDFAPSVMIPNAVQSGKSTIHTNAYATTQNSLEDWLEITSYGSDPILNNGGQVVASAQGYIKSTNEYEFTLQIQSGKTNDHTNVVATISYNGGAGQIFTPNTVFLYPTNPVTVSVSNSVNKQKIQLLNEGVYTIVGTFSIGDGRTASFEQTVIKASY